LLVLGFSASIHFVLASHPPSFTSLQRAIRCNLLQRFQDLKLTSISAPHCERRSKAVDLEIKLNQLNLNVAFIFCSLD